MDSGDSECVQHCLDGHPEAFRDLMTRYQAGLLAFLAGRLGSRDRAEEAAQETFVRAFFGLPRLRKSEAIFSWLLGIAHHVVHEQMRTEQREREAAQERASLPPEADLTPTLDLERAIGRLAAPYQEVVLLRYYNGHSCSQVAERLGLPLGTVTKRLSRAYQMLREQLQNDQEPEVRS